MRIDEERPAPAGRGGAARTRGGVLALGVDVGSTNVKAVLVRLHAASGTLGSVTSGGGAAEETAVEEVAIRSARTPDGAEGLVAVVLDLVRSVLDGRHAPEVVGIASMAETGVPLAGDGRALTDLLRWDGGRGARDAEDLAGVLGRDALVAATGVRPSPKVPLATWAWLRRTQPGVWRRTARWAGAADLVCRAMTGRLVTDHTLAGRTMAYRLPDAGRPLPEGFDADLLAAVGLRPEQLPDVAPPGEAAGTVVDPAFVAAGLTAGTPVVVAGHDHPVGAWGAGMRAPGDRADSVGTAEAVMTVLGGAVDRSAVAAQGMSLVRTVAGTHEAVMAGSPSAGAMVRWWLGTVLPGRSMDDVVPGAWGAGLTASGTTGLPTGLLVLPYLHGRQSPAPDPTATVRVLDEDGRDVTHAALTAVPPGAVPTGPIPPDAVRRTVAMLEGLALQARWMLAEQARIAGDPGPGADARRPLVVLGGAGAANAVWMALKAAVTGADVHLVGAAEPVATSAAILSAERLGLVPADGVRLPVRVLPAPADPGRYDRTSDRFVAAATRPAAHPT